MQWSNGQLGNSLLSCFLPFLFSLFFLFFVFISIGSSVCLISKVSSGEQRSTLNCWSFFVRLGISPEIQFSLSGSPRVRQWNSKGKRDFESLPKGEKFSASVFYGQRKVHFRKRLLRMPGLLAPRKLDFVAFPPPWIFFFFVFFFSFFIFFSSCDRWYNWTCDAFTIEMIKPDWTN